MKKCLIHKLEVVENGYRICQVEDADSTFEVAKDLFWLDCDNNIIADKYYYDPSDNKIKLIPIPSK
jgi:hypothetical protein